jgi:uncharacterized NAD-dependent epimerase/dehydratase family protein
MPLYLLAAKLTNPHARFVGVTLNTSALDALQSDRVLQRTADELGLPCVDPMRGGVEPIVRVLDSIA